MTTGFQPVPHEAAAGDRLVVRPHHLGESERDAEILEVLGTHGGPPYRVRWTDDGHETVVYPGSDVYVATRCAVADSDSSMDASAVLGPRS
jgi:hypothetical protein